MDATANTRFVDFQASTRFFFDTSAQCFDHCVKNFDAKELDMNEKECVNSCFTKQMVVYSQLVQSMDQRQKTQ